MGFDLEDLFRKSGKYRTKHDRPYGSYYPQHWLAYAKKFALVLAIWGVLLIVALVFLAYFAWSLASPLLFETADTLQRWGVNGLLDSLRPLWDRIMNGSQNVAS